jgi:hypothetical protein
MTSQNGIPRKHPAVWAGYIFVAIIFCAWMSWNLWQGVRTRSWKSIPCVIEKAEITWHQGWTGTHYVSARYRYEVDGISHVGTRFRGAGDSTHDPKILEQFVPGTAANCYVNPRDPRQAVLRLDIDWKTWFCPFLMAGTVIIFVACGIREVRLRRQERTAVEAPPLPGVA